MSCELARYDTLSFGRADLENLVVYRFNPHTVADHEFPDFVTRVKTLVQEIRYELNRTDTQASEGDKVVKTQVKFFFYPPNSKQVNKSLTLKH